MALEVNTAMTKEQLKKKVRHIMEVAGIKAYEHAVERTPARGESKYSSGQLRESIRMEMVSDNEVMLWSPARHSMFLEYGTGPRGQATGAMPEYPEDAVISYHQGEVIVTRHRGRLLDVPYIRHTRGMEAQPFMRPALLRGFEVLKELLADN